MNVKLEGEVWRRFMQSWQKSLEHRVMKAEMCVKLGKPDPGFRALADEVETFAEACRYLKTLGEKPEDDF